MRLCGSISRQSGCSREDVGGDGEADGEGRKYYDSGEIRQIGHIDTPWPSWHVVASTSTVLATSEGKEAVKGFLEGLNRGVKYFLEHQDEAVEWIYGNLDYSEEDAREWLKTVKFSEDVTKVREEVVGKCVAILRKAGVVKREEVDVQGMVEKL